MPTRRPRPVRQNPVEMARSKIKERAERKVEPPARKSTKTKVIFPIEVDFEFEKETKNTIRFKEIVREDASPIMTQVYVDKSVFGGKIPKRIFVDIVGFDE